MTCFEHELEEIIKIYYEETDESIIPTLDEFYDWCVEMSKHNTVLISEYNMPEDRFECVWSKEYRTSLDKNNNKKDRIEKLFAVK